MHICGALVQLKSKQPRWTCEKRRASHLQGERSWRAGQTVIVVLQIYEKIINKRARGWNCVKNSLETLTNVRKSQIVENVKHAFLIRFYNCKRALEWIAVRTETQKRAIKNYRYAHNNNSSTIYWLVVIECWEMQWMHAIMQQKWSEWGKTVANTADLSMQSMMTSIIAFVVASFVVGLCKLAKW